jgi:hypothetical protein
LNCEYNLRRIGNSYDSNIYFSGEVISGFFMLFDITSSSCRLSIRIPKHYRLFERFANGIIGSKNKTKTDNNKQEDKNMTIEEERLLEVSGGTVNKNPSPTTIGWIIDQCINGHAYDAIAQFFADLLNGDDVRNRQVKTDVDIYDCEI